MCDTFIALPNFTKNGSIIFGKNSDREPNEAQDIVHIQKRKPKEKTLKCTYIAIPQVAETHEIILSKPFWMWGAEMGANEHGLVIGNEAVFTKIKFKKTNQGLTGMDLLRLALERTKTAKEGLNLITDLMQTYGVDVCGGYKDKNFYYHNSFIIADKTEAWILETADIHWVAKKVNSFGSISNGLSIETDYDLISENAIDFAQKKGWHKPGEPFNFAKSYSNKFMNWASACAIRQHFSAEKGAKNKGNFTVSEAIDILKSHHSESGFLPSNSTTKDICMHATGLLSPSHTVGSMVVEVRPNAPSTIWITGTSNPCLSLFKPVYFGGKYKFSVSESSPNNSFWWMAEKMQRQAQHNYEVLKYWANYAFEEFQKRSIENDTLFMELLAEGRNMEKHIDDLTKLAYDFHEAMIMKNDLKMASKMKINFPFFNLFWWKQNKVLKYNS